MTEEEIEPVVSQWVAFTYEGRQDRATGFIIGSYTNYIRLRNDQQPYTAEKFSIEKISAIVRILHTLTDEVARALLHAKIAFDSTAQRGVRQIGVVDYVSHEQLMLAPDRGARVGFYLDSISNVEVSAFDEDADTAST